ncbi:hypothetical protein D3C84_1317590 [compost metagenome]
MAVRVRVEQMVVEVPAEQSELPKLIGDIFADVGHGAVRANDHLGIFSSRANLRLL